MKLNQKLIVVLALILLSCTRNQNNKLPTVSIKGKSIPVLIFNNVKDTMNLSLSKIINNIKYVKLETKDENKLSGGRWTIGEKYIIGFCYDQGFFQFTAEGKYIRKLASTGNGPQEVNNPVWTISKDEDRLYIYDSSKPKGMLCFDLKSGQFLNSVPIALEGQLKNIFIEDDSVIICAPLIGTGNSAGENKIFWQSLSGKLINKLEAGNSGASFDNGEDLLFPVGGFFHLRPVNGDTIFQIKDFKMEPTFIFKLENSDQQSDPGSTTFSILTETPDLIIVRTSTVTEKVIAGPNSFRSKIKNAFYYVDKTKNKAYVISSFYNDYLGEKQNPWPIETQTGDQRYFGEEAVSLLKKINAIKSDPDIKILNRETFLNIGRELTENDNPILFIGTLTSEKDF